MKNGFEHVGDEEQEQQLQLHQPSERTDTSEPHPSDVVKQRRRQWGVLIMIVVVAILVIVLSIVLIHKKNSNNASRASSSSKNNESTPTFSPTLLPSLHPSKSKPAPSHSPTAVPSLLRKTPSPTSALHQNVTLPAAPASNSTAPTSRPPSARPSVTLSLAPSFAPSSAPSLAPSLPSPTASPSHRPTFRRVTVAPSMAPSVFGLSPEQGQPTLAPTTTTAPTITLKAVDLTLYNYVLQLLVNNGVNSTALQQTMSREYETFQFLIRTSQLFPSVTSGLSDTWWLQRYALTSLYASLRNTTSVMPTNSSHYQLPRNSEDHCDWRGITCDNSTVTQIVWPRRNLSGTLPWLEWTMLAPSLTHLDLSENRLQGTLPTSLYQLSLLDSLYLNSNNISGPLHSESIVQDVTWPNLTRLYLNDNRLTGSIPSGFQYNTLVRPLRFVLLQNNQLTGTFPANLNWNKLFYLDLGNNQLQGTLPDVGDTFFALRNLLLDHNEFQGTIPQSWGSLGGGRMELFVISHNQFTGSIPTGWGSGNKLLDLEVSNNNLTEPLDQSICDMVIMNNLGGNVIELDADCNICSCKYLCNACTNSSQ